MIAHSIMYVVVYLYLDVDGTSPLTNCRCGTH